METQQPAAKNLFDSAKTFSVSILSGGKKTCSMRFPNDEEWCRWSRAQKTVSHSLGRGKSQSEDVGTDAANAELFARIKQGEAAFDDYEAGMFIERIARTSITDIVREGDAYRVEMKVPGAEVVHVLRMPTAKEMRDFERASTSAINGRRSTEYKAFLEPGGKLYDGLLKSVEGYAAAVSIVHKAAAVSEVIATLSAEIEEDVSPE